MSMSERTLHFKAVTFRKKKKEIDREQGTETSGCSTIYF